MVLESFMSIKDAIKRPWHMFIFGGVVSVVALMVSFFVFADTIGIFTIFLITIIAIPFMTNLIRYEEAKEEEDVKKIAGKGLWVKFNPASVVRRQKDILIIYSAFFGGMILFLSIAFLLLPEQVVEKVFKEQTDQIKLIRGSITVPGTFEKIFLNNIGVLFIFFIFSFLFGAGAIFILAWNASVLAAAIGLLAQPLIVQPLGFIYALPLAVAVFFPHGSLEIIAYFIGGIAGGVISVSLSRRKSKMFKIILIDSGLLLIVSILLLFAAATVETAAIALA